MLLSRIQLFDHRTVGSGFTLPACLQIQCFLRKEKQKTQATESSGI